jgi:hypothetical protein
VTICALVLLTGAAVGVFDAHYRFFDMAIYHGAIRWWLGGGDLYGYAAPVRGHLGFTYPPVAAVLLTPFAALPVGAAGWLNAGLGVLALTLVLAAVVTPVAERLGRSRAAVLAVALPLALVTEPVRQTLGMGQVNLLLFALVMADLAAPGARRWAGIGVGVATAVKLTPGLFIVYLLVTGQRRTAWTAIRTVAALTAGGFVLAPAESVRYFGDLLWQTERVGAAGAVANQALTGMLARLQDTTTAPALGWIVLSLVVLMTGLRRARLAHAAGDRVTALTLVGLTANLISPMSWTHHLVFLPVAVVLLADSGLRRGRPGPAAAALGVYAVAVVSPIWFAPDHPVLGNAFTLMLLALVVALPVTAGPADPAVSADATGWGHGIGVIGVHKVRSRPRPPEA